MGNVLHVEAIDMAKATGFFKKQSGPENTEYVVYLPSVDCTLPITYGQVQDILEMIETSDIKWDYVTVHDGDYSASCLAFFNYFTEDLVFSPTARLNIPAWVGVHL